MRVELRRELIRLVGDADAATRKAWRPILDRMSRRLARASAGEVDGIIATAMRELAGVALQRNVRAIRQGIEAAAAGAARQHQQLTGQGGPMAAPGALEAHRALDADRRRRIADAIQNGAFARDRVPLSARLYRDLDEVGRSAGEIVRSSISAREGIFRGAERFIEANRDRMQVPIPAYAAELIDIARRVVDSDDRSELEEAIASHTARMDRLGVGADRDDGLSTLRAAVRQFAHDLRQATPQNLERIIARHIEDRAQYQARRVLRTETAEAHRRAFRASTEDAPYTIGYRWRLSPAHPRPDVCDLLANQALHGLGPGGYPKDQVPETPHPNCLCGQEAIVDEHYFTRQLAAQRGEPEPPRPWVDNRRESAEEWLSRQPEAFQRQLLGPTRAAILRDPADQRQVVDQRGVPVPVRRIPGA